jgi:hypothetical protein
MDGIEHGIQFPAYVLGKKAQHEVAVLLQQLIFPSIAPIRDRIREMLCAVEFDGYTRVGAQQVDLKGSEAVDGIGSATLTRNRPFVSRNVSSLR